MFSDYKLVSTSEQPAASPAIKRRQRLVMQIDRQLQAVKNAQEGGKPRGRWWTYTPSGTPVLAIKYGKVPLELGKGKFAISCDTFEQVVSALGEAKTAVLNGDFDMQLETISANIRAKFTSRH